MSPSTCACDFSTTSSPRIGPSTRPSTTTESADTEPVISAEVGAGDYAVFVAGQNIGTDLLSLGEEQTLSDAELAARKDLEWYRIVVVPGKPKTVGPIEDLEEG